MRITPTPSPPQSYARREFTTDLTKTPGVSQGNRPAEDDAASSGIRADANGKIVAYFGPAYKSSPPAGAGPEAVYYETAAAEAQANQTAQAAQPRNDLGSEGAREHNASDSGVTDESVNRMLETLAAFKSAAYENPAQRARRAILQEMRLSEKDIAAMPYQQRTGVEKSIADEIAARTGGPSANAVKGLSTEL